MYAIRSYYEGQLVRREVPLLLLVTTVMAVMVLDKPLDGLPGIVITSYSIHYTKLYDLMEEVAIKTDRYFVVLRAITDEYFVIFLIARDGNYGKGRYRNNFV